MYATHAVNDEVVPHAESVAMVAALRAAGNARVTFVELEGPPPLGHDAWTETYASDAWWAWFDALPRRPQVA